MIYSWKYLRYAKTTLGIALIILSMGITSAYAFAQVPKKNSMSQEEYEARKRGQDKFHALLREGDYFAKQGDEKKAEQFYLEAFEFAKGTSSEAVALGNLARFYENVGEYQKSLQLVNEFLSHLNAGERSWHRYTEMKQRLLQKIEDKTEWESRQDSIVPQFKESFEKASHEEQAEVLKTFGGSGVRDEFKNAMVAEHGGDYAKAREIYESLLSRKEEIDTQMGVGGWAMLHPAIQRTSELLGDEEREKAALVWIKTNLLDPEGEHHASLSKLQPWVVSHIQERIEAYKL
ncbi:hypothetical protein N9K06_00605 [Omnitrophica bacterium]|nr:hypothetical protein [Candidatus Omnitrophota bacterium]